MGTASMFGSALERIADKSVWSILMPDSKGSDKELPPGQKKLLLRILLDEWWLCAGAFADDYAERLDLTHSPEGDEEPPKYLRPLLEALSNATDVLLGWYKIEQPIELPLSFREVATELFAKAETLNMVIQERSIYQMARRLAAADPGRESESEAIRIDESGKVYGEDGKRRFEVSPVVILKGELDVKGGKASSLSSIQQSEA